MGIITSIRKRGGLLITLIGLAVAGFVVMDVVQNRNMSGSVTSVGTVDNKSLDFNELRSMEEILYQGSDADEFSKREYIWNYFMESTILNKAAEKSGLVVGKQELLDMEFGANLSPIMQQRYSNQQTGRVDMAQLQNVKDQIQKGTLPANMASFWAIQEKEIIKERLDQKLTSLFTKAVYTPTWQAQQILDDQTKPVNTLYVKVPSSFIGDTEIKLTDADYQKYIDEHKSVYTTDVEKRIISTVNVPVLISKADTVAAEQAIASRMEEFRSATNDSAFVLTNNGTISDAFVKSAQLDEAVKTRIATMNTGDVFGPYINGAEMKAVKVLGKSAVADSVKSRHILINAKNPQEFEVANKRIDSAMAVIKSGQGKFGDVARAISMDGGSAAKGGELPFAYQGQMVKPFNDALFFDSKPGQIKKVESQFGVHLLEILDKKTIGDANGYKVAYLSSELIPSEETQNASLAQVENILSGVTTIAQLEEKLKKVPGLTLQKSYAVTSADFALQSLPPGQGSREIIKWAFDEKTKVNQVSPNPFAIQTTGKYYVEQYVIAVLNSIIPKGKGTVEALKSELTPMVMAVKKNEKLLEKAKSSKTLEALAQQFSVKLDTAKSVTFSTNFTPGIGKEPKVVAYIYSTPINSTSPIIVGEGGIFMVRPYEVVVNPVQPPIENAKRFYTASIAQQMNGKIVAALKKKTDIEDNRGELY